jgi:hypothetical protein
MNLKGRILGLVVGAVGKGTLEKAFETRSGRSRLAAAARRRRSRGGGLHTIAAWWDAGGDRYRERFAARCGRCVARTPLPLARGL